jgi:hypothetical protein
MVFLSGIIWMMLILLITDFNFIFKIMKQESSTPSVDFNFSDAPDSNAWTPPALE